MFPLKFSLVNTFILFHILPLSTIWKKGKKIVEAALDSVGSIPVSKYPKTLKMDAVTEALHNEYEKAKENLKGVDEKFIRLYGREPVEKR